MLIVDSQVHIWGADTAERPWPTGRGVEAQKPYPVTRDMLLFEMELAKVDRIVLVAPSWGGDRNDLALEAARLHPDTFAVMGRLNLADPASKALVPDWKKQPVTSSPTAPSTGCGRPPKRPASPSWCWSRARSIISIALPASTRGSSS